MVSEPRDDGVALQDAEEAAATTTTVRVETTSNDDGDDDGDEALGNWKQFVFQRPGEGMAHLEIFSSGGYEHLLVLNLQQNAIQDIAALISVAPMLRVLNLAQNEISQLPNAGFWSQFQNLTFCFLAQNRIQQWKDMDGLQVCDATLRWLTLQGNPISALANARPFVVNKLPFLRALDDFVVTDQEYMKEPRASTRFAALSPQMDVSSLRMPLEFAGDSAALNYLKDTESSILAVHAKNSPIIIAQRVVRGFISRSCKLPRLTRLCELVVKVQKHVRGFLFRRMIQKAFFDLVVSKGQQDLLTLSSTDSALLPSSARRGLKKLVVYIQEWKRKFHLKKQAIAIKKIRFWCQMAYQRYMYKSKLLLKEEQEVFIYYTPAFEKELLEIAEKAAHRDPSLMAMAAEDRERFIKERCARSGVSVLRVPHQSTCSLQIENPNVRTRKTNASNKSPKRAAAVRAADTCLSAIVRIFPSDFHQENHLLITEKQFLHQDMERIMSLRREHQLALNASGGADDPLHVKQQPRAILVHLNQLYLELEKRLVIVNKKILNACIKLQQWKTRAPMHFSLARVKIRPRGHHPVRWEHTKIKQLLLGNDRTRRTKLGEQYQRMRVLIPWSIDMYLQIMSMLDRTLAGCRGPAFALSYEQTRKVNAAISIQSAWRAFLCQSKRNSLEVAISRALLCIQRWWRFRIGLRRRLDFVRSCLLLCATINSSTLFMEESVYRVLSSAGSWSAVRGVMRACKEQSLHCRMVDGKVEIALSPGQLLLRKHSQRDLGLSALGNGVDGGFAHNSFKTASNQRCGAYFPVWLPGTPGHNEESMSSRDDDATPLLLVERVQIEPTLLERELMVGLNNQHSAAEFAQSSLYRGFAMCRRVIETSAHVMELSRRLSYTTKKKLQPWQQGGVQFSAVFALESTSFVRLTFESTDEARKRALVLLSKTYDPVTRSYARLYSVEALFGASLGHHQWALSQVATPEENQQVLSGCAEWLKAGFPSRWWAYVQDRLGPAVLSKLTMPAAPIVPTRPDSAPQFKRLVTNSTAPEYRATSSPSSNMIPWPPPPVHESSKLAPLHVTVPGVHKSANASSDQPGAPHPPLPDSTISQSPAPGGCNRHQLLTDRIGKPKYEFIEAMQHEQLEEREYLVRDLREERERAMEALIVDRRMIQRENAAEVAGIKLDIDVKLQKLRYEREVNKLHVRELIEKEKFTSKRNKLTKHFEKTFASQTGAMMRLAVREAVMRKREKREEVRKEVVSSIKASNSEALERRQDAKSYWFVSNQKTRAGVSDKHVSAAEQSEEQAHLRLVQIRKRIKEDKEIKSMLRLM